MPLITSATTDTFIQLSNSKGYGITLNDINLAPKADFGIISAYNGEIPKGLTVEQGSGAGGASIITADIDVIDVDQGRYGDGDVVSTGTPIEDVIKDMLQKTIPPVDRKSVV